MKKLFILFFSASVGFGLLSCSGDKKTKETAIVEENVETEEPVQEETVTEIQPSTETTVAETTQSEPKKNVISPVGTWEVIDDNGEKWLFVYNEDKSVVIKNNGKEYYAAEKYNELYYGLNVYTVESGDVPSSWPTIAFPKKSGLPDNQYYQLDLDNNYIYAGLEYKTKAPNKRLPIRKIK